MIRTANITGLVSRKAGGLFESVRRLVQSLGDTGMEVRVFGFDDEFCAEDVVAWNPVAVATFKPMGPKQFGYAPRMLDEVDAFAPDIVHTHGIWPYSSVVTSRYAQRSGKPYLISPHGMLDPWAVRNSAWKKRIALALYERRHLEEAACLRALCESEAKAFRAFGLKNPICIIPNGIDLPVSHLNPNLTLDHDLPGQSPYPLALSPSPLADLKASGRKVLLYLGRIHPKKGLVNLLKAWAEIRHSEFGIRNSEVWTLAIAGWDQDGHEAELKALATEHGIPWADVGGNAETLKTQKLKGKLAGSTQRVDFSMSAFQHVSVLFLGPQFAEAKAACYRNCAAFILPSFSEGLPMAILEAWAYGKPVCMTPECNLPEGFALGAALRIETSVESIERRLRELFNAPDSVRYEMGVKGLALVQRKFTWPKVADHMKGVYEWLLGGGPKPECVDS